MRKLRYVLLAVLAYAIFLLATAPVRVVLPALTQGLPPGVSVTDVHGTIWGGRMELVLNTATGTEALSRVRFSFIAGALIRGRVGYALRLVGPVQGHMRTAFAAQVREFSDVALNAPAGLLASLIPAAQDFGPSGQLALRARTLVWGPHPAGQGTLTWSRAALVSAPVNPLGTYGARFVLAAPGMTYRIRTLSGALVVRGHGRYRIADRVLSFAGDVRGHGLRLGGLIQNIGVPDGAGGRRVDFRMTL